MQGLQMLYSVFQMWVIGIVLVIFDILIYWPDQVSVHIFCLLFFIVREFHRALRFISMAPSDLHRATVARSMH